jgi:hypothetical protein
LTQLCYLAILIYHQKNTEAFNNNRISKTKIQPRYTQVLLINHANFELTISAFSKIFMFLGKVIEMFSFILFELINESINLMILNKYTYFDEFY